MSASFHIPPPASLPSLIKKVDIESWIWGAGIAQWLERQTRDRKVLGLSPSRSGGRISSPGSAFCADSYFGIHSTPHVTTVACKRSRSCCQKCRWQVPAKHAYTLHMLLCMKWHGAWLNGVQRTCADSSSSIHVAAAMPALKYATSVNIQKTCYKKLVTHVESCASAVSLLKGPKNSAI